MPSEDEPYSESSSMTGWAPSSKTETAQGIPWLVARGYDRELLDAMERLRRDPSQVIRFLIVADLFRIAETSSVDFWSMVEQTARDDKSKWVLFTLCRTLAYVAYGDTDRTVEVLKKCSDYLFQNYSEDDSVEPLVTIILWLALVRQNDWAIATINFMAKDPLRFVDVLGKLAHYATEYVTPQTVGAANQQSEIAKRSINYLSLVVKGIISGLNQMAKDAPEPWTDESVQHFHKIYGVIDHLILMLYAHSDVDSRLRHNKPEASDHEKREYYNVIKPVLDLVINELSSESLGFILAPTAHRLMELLNGMLQYDPVGVLHFASLVSQAGAKAGYQQDSLAVAECVGIVESMLTDFRTYMRDPAVMADVLALLDVFANVGWPTALQLVWRLDEVFR